MYVVCVCTQLLTSSHIGGVADYVGDVANCVWLGLTL